jgi:heme A synthase
MKPHSKSGEPITLGERFATAILSAIAAAITLFCYFLANLAFASKRPSGPPNWLFDLFASKLSVGIVTLAGVLGFVLGSERISAVFAVLWGTSDLWKEAWFNKLMACVIVVVVVLVIAQVTHGFRTYP